MLSSIRFTASHPSFFPFSVSLYSVSLDDSYTLLVFIYVIVVYAFVSMMQKVCFVTAHHSHSELSTINVRWTLEVSLFGHSFHVIFSSISFLLLLFSSRCLDFGNDRGRWGWCVVVLNEWIRLHTYAPMWHGMNFTLYYVDIRNKEYKSRIRNPLG